MKSLRTILKNKILSELYDNSKPTHYDKKRNIKVKVFNDTIDFIKNTAKAELTSGKNKGFFTIVNLDNLVELNPNNLNMVSETSNLPLGAEFDSGAPWNDKNNTSLKKYSFDDIKQKFFIELTNGNEYEIDYIDFLEEYWKNNPGSFESHEKEFGKFENDALIIELIRNQGYDFRDILESIAKNNGWLEEEEEEDKYNDTNDY